MMGRKEIEHDLADTERTIVAIKDQIKDLERAGKIVPAPLHDQLRRLKGSASAYRKILNTESRR